MKAKKYEGGGKVTKAMVDEMDTKSRNEMNDTAKSLSKTLEKGYKEVNGFPRPLTAAQKKAMGAELARLQEKLGKKTSYKAVGSKLPAGDAPMEDDAMFKKGGLLAKLAAKRAGAMGAGKGIKAVKK
jgi:hypothetical protein